MTALIVISLGILAFLLVISLIKKLVKLAFSAVTLLLIVGGIWYFFYL